MSKKLKSAAKQTLDTGLGHPDHNTVRLAFQMSAIKPYAPYPAIPAIFTVSAKKINRLRTSEKNRRARARAEYADGY
ncbi:hypothetical protein ACC696_36645 [Rhizobium ruizarguesonis]|jgi:ribosomal protein L23|uniref:Uncharacterized protein n=1 Tax=Rhizobium ruizarguesonis TaxID=2081791 RepID=A0ABY1X7F4_9HYPH|nr:MULTISPECIES: hypothetical protein [Rhizobium]MBY3328532.1 hypothetical protein [Rhizobium laguerreae]TAX81148.1 hypothetical protein ELH98_08750 [Rhizobium ruizarguesonis]TBD84800.1 hypothetical protein ELH13_08105 [Rhizobium ruizarguesonis]TBE22883.1 hypothetical protein ELH08_08240 [Rhizobium ruizarguesonis]